MQRSKYQIITNSNDRNILVINDVVEVEREPDIFFEDFDAVFINVIAGIKYRVLLAIRLASPIRTEKCRFKPCFVTQRLNGWLGSTDIIIDGYAQHPTDNIVTQGIEDIYSNMQRMNFMLGADPVITHADEILRVARYAITRGLYTFSSSPIVGASIGFMAIYYYTMWNEQQEMVQSAEREYLINQLLELGYIRKTRFIDKIHVCPECGSSHLHFIETCPKCNSSDIQEEKVIHHFRCANVAPETAYEYDGELRCPKCKRLLLHIGVDYDKPTSIYTCNQCNGTFMYPQMKVFCAQNRHLNSTDQLKPIDVVEYEFTADGIRAFAANDIQYTIRKMGFYGYSSITDFMGYIRFCASPENHVEDVLIIAKFHLFFTSDVNAPYYMDDTPTIKITKWLRRLFYYKSAQQGDYYYFMCRAKTGTVADMQDRMTFELRSEFSDLAVLNDDFQFTFINVFRYHPGEDVNLFISRIEEQREPI